MIVLYYEIPGLAGARMARSLEFGLDFAYRMLSDIIDTLELDGSGWWYCGRTGH